MKGSAAAAAAQQQTANKQSSNELFVMRLSAAASVGAVTICLL